MMYVDYWHLWRLVRPRHDVPPQDPSSGASDERWLLDGGLRVPEPVWKVSVQTLLELGCADVFSGWDEEHPLQPEGVQRLLSSLKDGASSLLHPGVELSLPADMDPLEGPHPQAVLDACCGLEMILRCALQTGSEVDTWVS